MSNQYSFDHLLSSAKSVELSKPYYHNPSYGLGILLCIVFPAVYHKYYKGWNERLDPIFFDLIDIRNLENS